MTARDLDVGDHVVARCPSCADGRPQPHEVLKPSTQATVRCLTCDHVHKTRIEPETTEPIRVVVSVDDESLATEADVPTEETLAVGEEFVVETDDDVLGVRITSLELEGDRRVESAPATAINTIWTRAVDNVAVNVTVHPADGRREATTSDRWYVPGDETVEVGEQREVNDATVRIERIQLREDAIAYSTNLVDRAGEPVQAKDINRVYAREQGASGWRSAWDEL